jgi:hypothetical protein
MEKVLSIGFKNLMAMCKTQSTKTSYKDAMNSFLKWSKLPEGDYDKLLAGEIKTIQQSIINYIIDFSKDHAAASVALHTSAIQKFYTMNDIILNWKKIKSFQPESERFSEDRPYTHEEIKAMVEASDLRNKAIILFMSSSGVRVGALPELGQSTNISHH